MLQPFLSLIATKVLKNKHLFPLCFLFKGQDGLDGERGKPGQQGLPVRDAALLIVSYPMSCACEKQMQRGRKVGRAAVTNAW